MATPTYTALATLAATGSESSVTFSSIPATYRDIVAVINAKNTLSTAENLLITFNADTTSWTRVVMFPTGSATASTRVIANLNSSTQALGTHICQIMDYSATDKHKTVLTRSSKAEVTVDAQAMRWASTSAVTSIEFSLGAGNFASGSVISIYGIEA